MTVGKRIDSHTKARIRQRWKEIDSWEKQRGTPTSIRRTYITELLARQYELDRGSINTIVADLK